MKDKLIEAMARAMWSSEYTIEPDEIYTLDLAKDFDLWISHSYGFPIHQSKTSEAKAAYDAIEAMGFSVVPSKHIHHFNGKAYDISDMKPLDPEIAKIWDANTDKLYEL